MKSNFRFNAKMGSLIVFACIFALSLPSLLVAQIPSISCPADTALVIGDLGEIKIEVVISDYDVVDAGSASWANDTLTFNLNVPVDSSFRVIATNITGADTCDVSVSFPSVTTKSGTIDEETWSPSNSPYCIVGDINVANLVIEPGVEVRFFGDFAFDVTGVLVAIGNASDSIYFRKAEISSGWRGISFADVQLGSELAFCVIQDATSSGVTIDNSTVSLHNLTLSSNSSDYGAGIRFLNNVANDLTDCIIEGNTVSSGSYKGGGVYCAGGDLTITDCKVVKNSVTGLTNYAAGGGIYFGGGNKLLIDNCYIVDNTVHSGPTCNTSITARAGGILASGQEIYITKTRLDSNTVISQVTWCGVKFSSRGQGSAAWLDGPTISVVNCTAAHNVLTVSNSSSGGTYRESGGVYLGTSATENTLLQNCTFYSNGFHGILNSSSATIAVLNSILWGNSSSAQVSGNMNLSYSCVENGTTENNNITDNPAFYSPDSLVLTSLSPCVDAGHPDPAYNDIEDPISPGDALRPARGTVRNDMGAFGGPYFGLADIPTDVAETDAGILPDGFAVSQNYPNPFNPATTIGFQLPVRAHVSITIFNAIGQQVRQLLNDELSAGSHRVRWDGRSSNGERVSSGIYLYRIQAANFQQTRKMILLK